MGANYIPSTPQDVGAEPELPISNVSGESLISNGDGTKTWTTLVQDAHKVHNQLVASATWSITHNLNKYPSVTVVDSLGAIVIGDITYINENELEVSLAGASSGKAYLN